MSAIATLKIFHISHLKELEKIAPNKKSWFGKEKDKYIEYSKNNTSYMMVPDISGWVFGDIICYLDQKEIMKFVKLENNNLAQRLSKLRGYGIVIFSDEEIKNILNKLNEKPKDRIERDLREFCIELNGEYFQDENSLNIALGNFMEIMKKVKEDFFLIVEIG